MRVVAIPFFYAARGTDTVHAMADADDELHGGLLAESRVRDRLSIRRPSTRTGFVLGILGAALYLAGTTVLPYASRADSGPGPSTLLGQYRLAIRYDGFAPGLAAMVALFGIAVLILVVSIGGLRSDRHERWALALIGASSIWFLRILEELLYVARFPISFSWLGARAQDLGICLAFAGGLAALIGCRVTQVDDRDPAAEGFLVALGGSLLFVLVSFLPFSHASRSALTGFGLSAAEQALAMQPHSLAHGVLGSGVLVSVRGVLHVYGAAAAVGILAFGGLFGRRQDRWAAALVGAAAAWCTSVPSVVLAEPIVRLVGLWGTQVAICIALVGGIVAAIRTRRYSRRPRLRR